VPEFDRMTTLSVNINKIATLRNARGGSLPNVVKVALDCERFGAQGITVHPRPDERHIRFQDVRELKPLLSTEFNIEGYPSELLLNLVWDIKPAQLTLVPDAPDAITSNAGWDTKKYKTLLSDIISEAKRLQIRTSIFVNPDVDMIEHALETGTDRIELYTENFAKEFLVNRDAAIKAYVLAARKANELGIGINAGHDLNLQNLAFFSANIPGLLEVSIGHALICDALYYGLECTIQKYRTELEVR
jgi:pyridoxine 5-phosphate synthase